MFEQFFGLSENPFSLTPDPRFIFASRCHDEALAHLKYWLEHKEGFALVTGEVGTGKTTALFRLIDGLERRYEIAFLTNSTLSPVDLLEEICRKFGMEVEPGTSKPALLQKLETYLKRQAERGNGSLLIIDEAQNFEQPLLEEVRLLSNIARPGGPPMLQIALIGQPELERKLSLPELRQLKQRIGVHYRIEPLSADEALRYIHHRVSVAGGYPRVLFPPETVSILYQKTFGLPREINQVGSQALLGAYVEDSTTVRPEHILGAIREMSFSSVLEGAEAPPAPRGMSNPAVVPETAGRPLSEPGTRPVPIVVPPPQVVPPLTTVVPPLTVQPVVPVRSEARPVTEVVPPRPVPIAPIPVEMGATTRPPAAGARPSSATAPRGAAPPASGFNSLAPLSTPRVDNPPNEGRARLARIGLVIGAIAILATAGYLLFMPQKAPRDELADLENEKTMPVAPGSGATGAPMGSVPTPSRSADAAGTSGTGHGTGGVNQPAGSPANNVADPRLSAEPATLTPPPVSMPVETAPVSTPSPGVSGSTASMLNSYRLQVASLLDSTVAVRVGNDLASRSGLPLLIARDRKADGTSWYAINLGAFPTREKAAAAKQELGGRIREIADAIIRTPRGR